MVWFARVARRRRGAPAEIIPLDAKTREDALAEVRGDGMKALGIFPVDFNADEEAACSVMMNLDFNGVKFSDTVDKITDAAIRSRGRKK